MKSDSVAFNTRMTLQQIIQVLNSYKCQIQSIQPDPFAQDKADIEVLMVGMATMADAFVHAGAGKSQWGVQVYVYDMGKYRSVELVALGESGFKYAWTEGRYQGAIDTMLNGQQYINIRHSKQYRDDIMRKLQPVTSGRPKGSSDASKSRLFKAIEKQKPEDSRELADEIFATMPAICQKFIADHPDFSEQGLLTVPKEELRIYVPELLQTVENDAIEGNDRSALYTLIYLLSLTEKDKDNERLISCSLLDRVLQLENSGADITEDLKIWPLFARYFDFATWHEVKYGENGTSGKLKADDPALTGAKFGADSGGKAAGDGSVSGVAGAAAGAAATAAAAISKITSGAGAGKTELPNNAGTAGAAGTSASKGSPAGGRTGSSFNKKYLIMAAALLAVIVLTAVIVNSLNKAKYEEQAAVASEDEYYEDSEAAADEYSEDQGGSAQNNDAVWRVYAHRGVGGEEETFASYDSAVEQGAKCIEQDVILSGGELYVSYVNKEQSQLEKDGNLRLRDVFDRYGDSVQYIVELKTRDSSTVNALANLVSEKGLEGNVDVQCFDLGILSEIHDRLPSATTVYLVDNKHGGEDGFEEALSKDYVDVIAVSYDEGRMDSTHCNEAHEAGKEFCAWVLDDENSIREAISLGVDKYFTRYPGLALELEKQYR